MKRKDMAWVWTGKRIPAKFGEWDKNKLKMTVEAEIEKSERIKKAIFDLFTKKFIFGE
jgi:hypothetical protein